MGGQAEGESAHACRSCYVAERLLRLLLFTGRRFPGCATSRDGTFSRAGCSNEQKGWPSFFVFLSCCSRDQPLESHSCRCSGEMCPSRARAVCSPELDFASRLKPK